MRNVRNVLLALLIGCLSPVVIWVVGGVALYQGVKRKAAKKIQNAVCSIDADCPSGYSCINGCCVPQ